MKYNLQTGLHTVYALQYHFVTVTKYRADVLTDEISERIGEVVNDLAGDFGVEIQNVNGGSEHTHILFTAKPTTDMTKFIKSMKGVTSRKIRNTPKSNNHSRIRSGNWDTFSQVPGK